MKMNHKCAHAVAAILGTHAGAVAYAAAADPSVPAEGGSSAAGIQEVVVTAQRRTENVQDVPIAIQAFTGEALQQLNVMSLDDLIRYLPNVATASAGNSVRCGSSGRRDPLYHEQAEAQRDGGKPHRRLRRDRGR